MTGQAIVVAAVGLAALGYILHRFLVRRRAPTCCGAKRCPAGTKVPPPSDATAA